MAWIGPDIFNPTNITYQDLKQLPIIQKSLKDEYDAFNANFPYEIQLREAGFFHNFSTHFYQGLKIKVDDMWFNKFSDNYVEFSGTTEFQQSGFAVLKSANQSYYMKKTYLVIGRKCQPYLSKYEWEVDVDIQGNEKVSKQHALVVFNFEKSAFEVICLSSKNPIRVNAKVLTSSDKPCTLYDDSRIEVAGQLFHFLLPQNPAN